MNLEMEYEWTVIKAKLLNLIIHLETDNAYTQENAIAELKDILTFIEEQSPKQSYK